VYAVEAVNAEFAVNVTADAVSAHVTVVNCAVALDTATMQLP
jgi:hypothetical protein